METFKGKNAEELKKNHPQAYEIYRDVAEKFAGVQARAAAPAAGAPAPLPANPALPQPLRAPPLITTRQRLEMYGRMIERAGDFNEDSVRQASAEERRAVKDQIEAMERQLKEMRDRLDKASKDLPAAESK